MYSRRMVRKAFWEKVEKVEFDTKAMLMKHYLKDKNRYDRRKQCHTKSSKS